MAATQPTSPKGNGNGPRPGADKSVGTVLSELWTLSVAYAKQEIKDPLDGLFSTVLWGVVTMVLMGLGCTLLAIGGLRALQTETGSTFTGNLTWAPYGIVLAVAMVVLGLVGTIVTKGKKK